MVVTYSWLRELLPELDSVCKDVNEFCAVMTKAGTKVERLESIGANISNVVVGRIITIEKHKNADKLVITTVDVGGKSGEPVQIVTGAQNVYPGAYVPVALDGAFLADGRVIKAGELRGVASNGMLCSIEELGETRAAFPEAPEHGIYIFAKELTDSGEIAPGDDAADVLGLRDEVIEFELTSNRADCYSVIGIAREAAAAFNTPMDAPFLKAIESADTPDCASDYITVEIENRDLCPRYTARVVKNVKIGQSPLWMRRKLSKAGLRPINNIVDITNYVMLELGQPMHAFDIETIAVNNGSRNIIVRTAKEGEPFVTLDGGKYKLSSETLVIADCEKAVAIAGVMGGENSKVTDGAGAILFESANFNGASVRKTSKRLGLRTDSSARFEKNIDPELTVVAVNRACELTRMLGCGEVVGGFAQAYPAPGAQGTVEYHPSAVNKLLGANIAEEEMVRLLRLVEITAVKSGKDSYEAQIPSFRPDITIEPDIAEEVARLYGYDNIETTLVHGATTIGGLTLEQTLTEKIREAALSAGFSEALTLTFESPKALDKLGFPEGHHMRGAVKIINPLGEDYSIMRTQTVNALLISLANNYLKRNEEAALFEIAKRYAPEPGVDTPLKEIETITLAAYGDWNFYNFKGAVEAILSRVGIKSPIYKPNVAVACLHPGRSAVVMFENEARPIGFLGEVHPRVLERYGIDEAAYVCALDMERIIKSADVSAQYKPLPRTHAVKRDIAVVVADAVTHADIAASVKKHGGELLDDLRLFDVYRGQGIEEGCHSSAYNLIMRSRDKTMTDDEINAVLSTIIGGLREDVGAKLR